MDRLAGAESFDPGHVISGAQPVGMQGEAQGIEMIRLEAVPLPDVAFAIRRGALRRPSRRLKQQRGAPEWARPVNRERAASRRMRLRRTWQPVAKVRRMRERAIFRQTAPALRPFGATARNHRHTVVFRGFRNTEMAEKGRSQRGSTFATGC